VSALQTHAQGADGKPLCPPRNGSAPVRISTEFREDVTCKRCLARLAADAVASGTDGYVMNDVTLEVVGAAEVAS